MPFMRYSGSPTPLSDGSIVVNSPDRIFCPNLNVVNKTQMWVAIRAQPSFTNAEAAEHTYFRFGPDTNNELFVQYGPFAGEASSGRDSISSSGANAIITGLVFAVNDNLTLIGTWVSGTVGFSFNGSVFTTFANSADPDMTGATGWDIGQRGYSATGFANSDLFWVATGLGTLSDANAATIHGLANTGIGLQSFPVAPAFFWAGDNQQFYAPVAAYWVAA